MLKIVKEREKGVKDWEEFLLVMFDGLIPLVLRWC